LPADIKNTYDKLGIPEAEKQRLIAGVAAQYESEVVYHKIRDDLEAEGVLFLDTDTALREHPDLFREYFATVIPVGEPGRCLAGSLARPTGGVRSGALPGAAGSSPCGICRARLATASACRGSWQLVAPAAWRSRWQRAAAGRV
jgi:hypothetical protein